MDINLNTSTVGAGTIALGQGNEVKSQGAAMKPILGGDNIEVSSPINDISKLIETLKEENRTVAESLTRRFNAISVEMFKAMNANDLRIIKAIGDAIEELGKLNEELATKQEDRLKYLDDQDKLKEIDQAIEETNEKIASYEAQLKALTTQLSSATKRELGALFADMGIIEVPPEAKEKLDETEKAIYFAFLHLPVDQFDAATMALKREMEEMQNLLNDIDNNRQEMV